MSILLGLSRRSNKKIHLYYDSIGVLTPSARTDAGYRVYDDHDIARMERIDLYRRTGLPLARIKSILDSGGDSGLRAALELRLREIDSDSRRPSQHRIV